jgi:uncharacterized protein
LCYCGLVYAQAPQAVPELSSPVTDRTGTLSAEQRASLERQLLDFERRKGSQIAILIVPTTAPETIDQYSIRVVERNKIGRAKFDDGVLVLVAMQDRTARIEVGYGLEGAIPDVIAERIRRQIMTPRFQAGDFYGGLEATAQALMRAIEGERLPETPQQPVAAHQDYQSLFVMLLMFTIVGGGVLAAIFGKLFGSLLTGGIAGVLAWLLAGSLIAAIAASLLAFVFSLVMGASRGGPSGRIGRSGHWGGGWPGGFGGGGGGFGGGGWSGGGGGFGGGGASGRW